MKPTLAVFAYGGLSYQTFTAVIRDVMSSPLQWSVFCHAGDAAIDRARSVVATDFLESDRDVLVMVDHDVHWSVSDLDYLALKTFELKALAGGIYSKRALGEGFGGRFVDDVPHEIGSTEVVELGEHAYLGGGFMALHRCVVERMAEVLPMTHSKFYPFFMPKLKVNGELIEYLSEDWSFCDSARLTGSKVYCLMRPIIAHYGITGYTPIEGNTPSHA